MAKVFTRKRTIIIAVTLLILGIIFTIVNQRFHIYKRASFSFKEWKFAHEWRNKSLWLPDYQVTIEAKPVEGVRKNLSGLTWNGDTNSLFAIINQPAEIVELSPMGEALRHIKLNGFSDPEAIEYIGNNRYVIADERKQKLIKIIIEADTTEINAEGMQQLTLGMGLTGNKGIEGLAWDPIHKKLYAAKERDPVHIHEVTGFPQAPNTTMDIEVANNAKRDSRLFISDVSSLDFNQHYQHLLVLSDESKLILEISKEGKPISSLSLLIGHGLKKSIPQAEGIAMDNQDNLYLVSEPNLFYVFKKKPAIN